jgi:hypothetical protein
MSRSGLMATLLLLVVAAGCASRPTQPSPLPQLNGAELRYKLVDTFGPLWFCDPDFYPVARADEAELAVQRFPEVQADTEAFAAILMHLNLKPGADFDANQKLAIYRAWKQLNGVALQDAGNGTYRFDYLNMPAAGAAEGRRTSGTIDQHGTIVIEQQAPAGEPPCPICLARGTRIATPSGEVPVEDIRVGMRVWSIDATGQRVAATVTLIGQSRVPSTHEVVRLELADGRIVRASPGHPMVDGRLIGTIHASDMVDGVTVVSATLEPYDGGSTFDLLTDSSTHAYVADGIPLGSTLAAD